NERQRETIRNSVICRFKSCYAHQNFVFSVARHQTHRGLAPQDERLFAARQLPALRAAAADLCWLLDHGYAARSAVELVGNRHNLTSRQRMAVARHACSREDFQCRQKLRVEPGRLQGRELWLDGYNVL